jgi:hypothetical protein
MCSDKNNCEKPKHARLTRKRTRHACKMLNKFTPLHTQCYTTETKIPRNDMERFWKFHAHVSDTRIVIWKNLEGSRWTPELLLLFSSSPFVGLATWPQRQSTDPENCTQRLCRDSLTPACRQLYVTSGRQSSKDSMRSLAVTFRLRQSSQCAGLKICQSACNTIYKNWNFNIRHS